MQTLAPLFAYLQDQQILPPEQPASATLELAEEAIGVGKGDPYAGVASGNAARAQALAMLGHHDEARSALGALDNVFARLPEPSVSDRSSSVATLTPQR